MTDSPAEEATHDDGSDFLATFKSFAAKGPGEKPKTIPRTYVEITIPAEACAVAFGKDLRLTLRSLSAKDEIAAAAEAGSSPITLGFAMAKRALHRVGAQKLDIARRDFLMEALGPLGRSLVMGAYNQLAVPDEEMVGKAKESIAIRME